MTTQQKLVNRWPAALLWGSEFSEVVLIALSGQGVPCLAERQGFGASDFR